jgi:hypothetical protein
MPYYSLDVYTNIVPNNANYVSDNLGDIVRLYNKNLQAYKKEQPFTMDLRLCHSITSYNIVTFFNGTHMQPKDSIAYRQIFNMEMEEI